MSSKTSTTSASAKGEPAHFAGKLSGKVLLTSAERKHFCKPKAIVARKHRSKEQGGDVQYFTCWTELQAAMEVTIDCIAADSQHPALLTNWIKSEVKVTATKLVMRSTFEANLTKFVRDQVPSLCEGLSGNQIATLLGLRFDAEQMMMHVVHRRVYAVLSVFAVQQISGGKRNPIGSDAEALDYDWAGVRATYAYDPGTDARPPCTPRARSDQDEAEAELDAMMRSRRIDQDDDDGIPEPEVELPSQKELRAEKLRADEELRAAVDARIREFIAKDESLRPSSGNDGPPGKRPRTEFGPTDQPNGKFAMPSKAEVASLAARGDGPAPSEEAMCQSDEGLVRTLSSGSPPTVRDLWRKVQLFAGEGRLVEMSRDGVMQISEQRGRGSEPQTMEDLFRCHQLLVACIRDIDGTDAFTNMWIGTFTFTIMEASARTSRDVGKVISYYDRHFSHAWRNLARCKWSSFKLDRSLLSTVTADIDSRRRQVAQDRDSRGAHGGAGGRGGGPPGQGRPFFGPGSQQERPVRTWTGAVPDHMARTMCKNFGQGRPCALVNERGNCVFAHPRPPPGNGYRRF